MSKKLTTKQFVEKAKVIHENKYNYSESVYRCSHTKIKIICPVHGIFKQQPNNHLNKQGCKKCKGILAFDNKSFIEKANIIHNNKYDYSLVEYYNAKTKVKIICPKHGIFKQTPSNHLHIKKYGCKFCGGTAKSNTLSFIEKAKKIHGNRYDYSLVEYKNYSEKIKIICNKHGIFNQRPDLHLNGSNCPKCSKRISTGQEKLFYFLFDFYGKTNIILEKTIKRNKKKYFVDIFIPKTNTIVEYYGDYWHCNPKIYNSDYYHKHKKMYAKDIWSYDKKRKKILQTLGYNVIIVWEKSFKQIKNKQDFLVFFNKKNKRFIYE